MFHEQVAENIKEKEQKEKEEKEQKEKELIRNEIKKEDINPTISMDENTI